MSEWIKVDEVIKVINDAKEEKWSWMKNNRCKYISLRIDMRDGACIIRDRDGVQIEIDDLLYQYADRPDEDANPFSRLSKRVQNCLRLEGIYTLPDLFENKEILYKIPNMGKKSLKEVREFMREIEAVVVK